MFLLLSEFVKRDQPLALPQQLGVLQSGLIFSLGIHGGPLDDIDEVQFHSWAKAETNRRTETFGLSIALVQNFLFEFSPISLRIGPHVRFPCPPKIWDIPAADEFKRHTESIPNTDGLSVFFEAFLEGKVSCITDTTPTTLYIIAALLTQRVLLVEDITFQSTSDLRDTADFSKIE